MRLVTYSASGLPVLAAVVASIVMVGGLRGALGAALALIAAAIAAIDARRFIIPDALNAAALLLGLAHAWTLAPETPWIALGIALLRGAVLGLLFLGLREGYRRLRGRDGVGLGDVKLAAVAGVWLDWFAMALAVEIAALAGLAVFGLWHLTGQRTVRATSRVPFGVFLAPAIWIAWLVEALLLAPF